VYYAVTIEINYSYIQSDQASESNWKGKFQTSGYW